MRDFVWGESYEMLEMIEHSYKLPIYLDRNFRKFRGNKKLVNMFVATLLPVCHTIVEYKLKMIFNPKIEFAWPLAEKVLIA